MIKHLAILLFLCSCASCSQKEQKSIALYELVNTEAGLISGVLNNEVYVFKGIPYAEAPIGPLRWKAPQRLTPWLDTLDCKEFRASPMQNKPAAFRMWTEEFQPPVQPISEDCLFLNIWTPARSATEKLPVMIWVPGGAFINGSASVPIYDGEAIAKEGIIYVSINYRLNIFGFMAHPELTEESTHKSSGNYGIMDQIAAIQWVKNNIHAFGGDSLRITIAGQSAGSAGIQAVVSSPLANGLFNGVIAQSGTLTGRGVRSLQEAEQIGITLSEKFETPKISAMRNLSADSLLALGNTMPFGTYSPIVDGYVIPTDPKTIFANQQHQDVPLLAGWVAGDALREPIPVSDFKATVTATYKNPKNFFQAFPASTESESAASQHKLAIVQGLAFPYTQWAEANKSNSYLYQFTHVPVDKPDFPNYGAFHSAEIPYALNSLKYWNRPWRDVDYEVQKYMTAYWVNFVKHGDPNSSGLPEWKSYTKAEGIIMELGQEAKAMPHLFKDELNILAENSEITK